MSVSFPLMAGRRVTAPSVDLVDGAEYSAAELKSLRKFLPRESNVLVEAILNQTGLKVEIFNASDIEEDDDERAEFEELEKFEDLEDTLTDKRAS